MFAARLPERNQAKRLSRTDSRIQPTRPSFSWYLKSSGQTETKVERSQQRYRNSLFHDVACQFSEMPHNQQEESGEQSKNNLSNYSQYCSWYLNVFAKLCSLNFMGRLWVECEVVYIGSCCPSCGVGEMEHSIHLPCASRIYNKWCMMM